MAERGRGGWGGVKPLEHGAEYTALWGVRLMLTAGHVYWPMIPWGCDWSGYSGFTKTSRGHSCKCARMKILVETFTSCSGGVLQGTSCDRFPQVSDA